MQSGAHLFVSASSGRREGERKTERGEKRAKLEYDSINPAIERVEWQARRAGTTERAFQSMNRKKEEMTKRWRRVGGGWRRNDGKTSSTDDDDDEIPRSGSTNHEVKIDEPLSGSSRAQPDRKGRGGGQTGVRKRRQILDESLLSDTESRRRDFSRFILAICVTERLF